jgi:carboxyl-terminal processing protease
VAKKPEKIEKETIEQDGTEKKRNSKILVGAIIFLAFLFGWAFGHLDAQEQLITTNTTKDTSLNLFLNAWNQITQNYDGKINYNNMAYSAIDGMVKTLNDPYTMFLTPQETNAFNQDLSGSVSGIGAEVGVTNNQIVIISPIVNSPAQQAGLMAGDIILKINGTSTSGMDLNTAVSKIRGTAGTDVTLVISRNNQQQTYTIARANVEVPSVTSEVKNGDIGYIDISSFDNNTSDLIQTAVSSLKAKNVKALILDVRNNPGGYLDAAVNVSSEFLNKGDVVVTEKRMTGAPDAHVYKASGDGEFMGGSIPMVVLVNGGSASAAEIVSGALQDNKRAILIGEKTFGKGSVQTITNLGQGTTLHVTVAHWYTPNGINIGKKGLTPNITIALTQADTTAGKDPQLDQAISYLNAKIK